jgi:hypothetical protein
LKDEVVEGQEPLSFTSRAEFEAHFRKTHGDEAVVEVREAVVHATAKREQLSPGLGRLLRRNIEDAKKHLFEVSQKIAHGLERRGLKLFKRRAGKMFVSKVKPRAVDPGTVFSERIALIVERIKGEPGMLLAKLIAEIAPPAAPAEAPVAEGEAAAPAPAAVELTEAQKFLMSDLHWLTDEGFVILYSDDVLFLGVQGEPPHHTPEAKALAAASAEAETETPGDEASAEVAPTPTAEEPAVEAPVDDAPHTEAPVIEAAAPLPSVEEEVAAAETIEKTAPDPSGSD